MLVLSCDERKARSMFDSAPHDLLDVCFEIAAVAVGAVVPTQ